MRSNVPDASSLIQVGTVSKPQGIRGEIKIAPELDDAEDFRKFKRVFVGSTEYSVMSLRIAQDAVFLGLRGISDRDAAETLRGKAVFVLREDYPLPDGRYFIVDILGCEVFADGKSIGKVTDVRSARTDIYTVESPEKRYVFPLVDGLFVSVDTENKRIEADGARLNEVALTEVI